MTQTKKYESRHRLTWAAHYPLLPGRDLTTRQALLLQIADAAITGEYFESQKKLAGRVGLSVRSVARVLAKLCAEGALSARSRGFKRTTRYTLLRLAEVAEHGAFLPLGEASASPLETNPSSPQTTNPPPLDMTPTSSQTPQPPPSDMTPVSSQQRFDMTPVSSKEVISTGSKEKPPLTPPFILPAQEPGTISPTARRLHDYIVKRTGRPLPESWMFYPNLQQQVDPLNFEKLASVLAGILERTGGRLEDPEEFFKTYAEQKAGSTSKRKTNGRRKRRAA